MTLPLSDLERAAQRLQAAEAKVREFEGCFAPPTALTAQMIEAREAYEALANPATVLAMIERIRELTAALKENPQHSTSCSLFSSDPADVECNCGLDELLAPQEPAR